MISWLLFNIQTINLLYAVAGLGVLFVSVFLAYDYFYNEQKVYLKYLTKYVWPIIAITTIGGVATSLLYSEVFGFVPCSLCWLQRIALYPQALLVLAAFKLKDIKYFPIYGIILSGLGLLVAIYQYIYQLLPQELLHSGIMPCLADGTADCSKKVMEVFGFVTFPLLSAITFIFLIIIYINLKRAR